MNSVLGIYEKPSRPLAWSLHVAGLAAIYYAAARIGQLMAIEPGNVTAFWPCSGIALAAVLLCGGRIWPGIWLGSFTFNALFFHGRPGSGPLLLLVAAALATGATAQAQFAAWLIRRRLAEANPLDRGGEFCWMLVLGGPLGCTVAATVGVASLLAAGLIPFDELWRTWWTFWFGDTAGVLLVLPLSLILAAPTRKAWVPRLVGVAGLAATLALWRGADAAQARALQREFRDTAAGYTRLLDHEVFSSIGSLQAIGGFFAGSREVTRGEFTTFTRPLLARQPALRGVAWVPVVDRERREAFEREARGDGLEGFTFTEFDRRGQRVTAGERARYVPIYYMEPLDLNASAVGLDMASSPPRRVALERATDSGLPAATEPLTLVQPTGRRGVVIMVPIYHSGKTPPTVEERRAHIWGFANAVYEIDRLVEAAFTVGPWARMDLTIFDVTHDPAGKHLHTRVDGAADERDTAAVVRSHRNPSGIHHVQDLEIAGRRWRVVFTPTKTYRAAHWSLVPLGLLTFGLVLTALLTRYLALLADRAAESEENNRVLGAEIKHRLEVESKLRDLYNNLPDMYMTIDAVTGEVLECNQMLLDAMGLQREEVVGRPASDLYRPASRGGAQQMFQRFLETGEVRNAELMFRRRGGSLMDVMLNATAIRDDRGRVIRGRFVWRDITEIKRARRELDRYHAALEETVRQRTAELGRANGELNRKNEKLTELYETAHRFVDNVSHEFRTPLTVIKGYTDVLLQGIGGGLTTDQTEWLRLVADRTRDLAQMVDDLLDTSKLRVGMLRVDRRETTVDAVFDRVWTMLQSKALANKIILERRVGSGLPPIHADAEMAGRVVINLVVNAIKFSPEGCTVVVWGDRGSGGDVEVGVTDSGPGIDSENLKIIFERFRQVGDPQRGSTKGFGLGLNIARELVALNLGRINVISKPGRGSTFSFTVPTHDRSVVVDRYLGRLADYPHVGQRLALIEAGAGAFEGAEERLRAALASRGNAMDLILANPAGSGTAMIFRVCDHALRAVEDWERAWCGLVAGQPAVALPDEVRFRLVRSWDLEPGNVPDARGVLEDINGALSHVL